MESDSDIRELGKAVEEVVKDEATKMGIKALIAAVPKYGTAITLLIELVGLVSKRMQEIKDDELFRKNGTLLRDLAPPYDILRTYQGENDFIKFKQELRQKYPLAFDSLSLHQVSNFSLAYSSANKKLI